jgi:hypothetical protein
MSVFLNNLDDFIAPSQACVNPFVQKSSGTAEKSPESRKITLRNDFSNTEFDRIESAPLIKPDLIKTKTGFANQKVASVSLNDCLACRSVDASHSLNFKTLL